METAKTRKLHAGYAAMAADAAREREAEEWEAALIGDVADEPLSRTDQPPPRLKPAA